MVKSNLESSGVRVLLTRTDDTYYTLSQRNNMARRSGADVLISLHNNSNTSSSLSGTEVYYYRAMSKPLAARIHSRLVSAWQPIYSDNPTMYNKIVAADGGVRYKSFHVIRVEECPAVLVECGYLSNATECSMLCNQDVQSAMAKAVSDGIIDYLNS